VDVVGVVVGCGDGEQRGDRSGLHDVDPAVGDALLDVLRASVMGLDAAPEFCEFQDDGVGQDRCGATLGRGDRRADDPVVA